MRLSHDEIISLMHGHIGVTHTDGGLCFERFSETQKRTYDHCRSKWHPMLNDDYFVQNCFTDTGILLDMMTDAPSVTFGIRSLTPANGSAYVQADILTDGRLRRTVSEPGEHTVRLRPTRDGRLRRVTLLFPYFARLCLSDVSVPDGCTVLPVPRTGLWLAFGDSITHGCLASTPSRTLLGRLAVTSGYEIVSQASSGYVHDAAVLEPLPGGRQPDLITVAYGINDLGLKKPEANRADMTAFYEKLTALFPAARILMLSPIWAVPMGDTIAPLYQGMYRLFDEVRGTFADRVTLADGLSLVPHRAELYSPDGVHPADAGFAYYARSLSRIVRSLPFPAKK
ncbi:MAG: SGNH/GDSL hydrolase family protein [Clostridia bacterium]|nr:SGNH/GDSL hydrolase family protein [Clostridia bacterium]